jgi:hypothetical protein
MRRPKFSPGEPVEVRCHHRQGASLAYGWLAGRVVQADQRMAAIAFDVDVFAANGWPVPDRVLWCAHGSPNLRRPASEGDESA